jgi:hypothetical protein
MRHISSNNLGDDDEQYRLDILMTSITTAEDNENGAHSHNLSTNASTTNTNSAINDNRPVNININYIIKY